MSNQELTPQEVETINKMYDCPNKPAFQPLQTKRLPPVIKYHNINPSTRTFHVFKKFFSKDVFEKITSSTNRYAELNRSGSDENSGGRPWKPVTGADIKLFIASHIYMGLVQIRNKEMYWKRSESLPLHPCLVSLSLGRWQQIKRYFHIENPDDEPEDGDEDEEQLKFCHKVEWLAEHIRTISKELIDPGTNFSYDEAMVRFMGRSKDTIMAPHKPIKEGYEVMCLCTPGRYEGYVVDFFMQGKKKDDEEYTFEIPEQYRNISLFNGLSNTNKIMLNMILRTVNKYRNGDITRTATVYADNLFVNVPVLAYLRLHNIGVCGTFRGNAKGQPVGVKE